MQAIWDVIIAGAGPAGSTCAALLARRGLRVLVLEKEAFPRPRIGESLLPACLEVLERLELEPTPDTYLVKHGADFVCEATRRAQSFSFQEALEGVPGHAYHVERALFDQQVRDRAREWGATVRHEDPVQDVIIDEDRVTVTSSKGVEHARFFLDATGQNRLLARRLDSVRHYQRFGRSAVFTHFENVGSARDEVFGEANHIQIMIVAQGWGWIIPLPEGRLSVGVVSSGKLAAEDLDRGLLAGPMMRGLAQGARRLETQIVGNYGYENTRSRGARFATVGDACAFLDPVFSSGVTLALRSAAGTADVLADALEGGREAHPQLLEAHHESMTRAYRTFAALIERFYHSRIADSIFLREAPLSDMRRGIMSVLAGDVWRQGNPFQEMLLNGRTTEAVRRTDTVGPKGTANSLS